MSDKTAQLIIHPANRTNSTLPAIQLRSTLPTNAAGHRDILSRLPVGLVPSDPSRAPKTVGSLVRAKIQTAHYREFELQTGHAAAGMENLERVQKSLIELSLLHLNGEKGAAELTRDIATIQGETGQIVARARVFAELYPEHLELERARLVREREDVEALGRDRSLQYQRALYAVQLENAIMDRDALIARSEGAKLAAENRLAEAEADARAAIVRARSAAEVATLRAETPEPILPRERRAWKERRTTEAAKRAEAERQRVDGQRLRDAASIIANQAVSGAVQLPDVSPYSAFSWLTYQQEYDRFAGDHEKAIEATIAHLVKRMQNGGISLADAKTSYDTYEKVLAASVRDASHAHVTEVLEALGVADARN